MNNISALLKNFEIKKSKINSERADLVSQFLSSYNLNTEKKYQITGKRMAMKLAHVPLDDLYWLIGECKKAKVFGKKLNWFLKVKK